MITILGALLLGYLLGSLPTAAIAAQIKGGDIFKLGSGNMGALNTARNLGWGWGIVVAAVDVAKGAAASYAGLSIPGAVGGDDAQLVTALVAGAGAVLGHAYSPWVGFSGGKAIAATFGATLPLLPTVGLAYLLLILLLYGVLRNVTLAGLIGALALPLLAILLSRVVGWESTTAGSSPLLLLLLGLPGAIKHAQALRKERTVQRAPS